MGRIFNSDRGRLEPEDIPPGAFVASAPHVGARRPFTAAAEKIDLNSRNVSTQINRATTRAWQTAAWDYYDAVGEVKFGFSLIGSIMSRIRIFPAITDQSDAPPVELDQWIDDHKTTPSDSVNLMRDAAVAAINGLDSGFVGGGIAEFMREAAMNIGIAGEFYLVQPKGSGGKWYLASVDELRAGGTGSVELRSSRDNASNSATEVPKDSYVARIWRTHPRWSSEPESSMLGVLDQIEKLVMFDRVLRVTARSRMHAGAIFIPDGISVKTSDDDPDDDSIEAGLIEGFTAPTTDEGAMSTIVPQILIGPADLGKEIKKIDFGREIDPEMMAAQKDALNRTLQGLDFPKDIVTGLADVKYSNAIVIDDNLYRAHIEPLALLIVDSLTAVLLHPLLRKAGVPEMLIQKCVIWYDPSEIVTRPDRSYAANEGYDRKTISADAWRDARGFTDADAPTPKEVLMRTVLEDGQIPPELMAAMLEFFAPDIFAAIRAGEQQQAGMDAEVVQALQPAAPGTPELTPARPLESATPTVANERNGEKVTDTKEADVLNTGGTLPPRQKAS